MIIRPAARDDMDAVLAIEAQAGNSAHWTPEDIQRYQCTVVETREAGVIGFILIRQVASDEYEVLQVAVSGSFRGQGVATELLRTELRQRKGDWYLEVRPSNIAARNLYKKLGFRDVGLRHGYYENPPEPGIVMSFRS